MPIGTLRPEDIGGLKISFISLEIFMPVSKIQEPTCLAATSAGAALSFVRPKSPMLGEIYGAPFL